MNYRKIRSKKAEGIITELIDQYAYADQSNKPWIIGFSGGKDSTVLLTLVWIALRRIKENFDVPFQLKRPVYVVCNDTMVENPIIAAYVEEVLKLIDEEATKQGLPIFVKKTTPKLEETFWINVLGKGYPVPNNTFRWCTDRLKIRPTSNFLLEQLDEMGEAIVLLGTRYDESTTRKKSIKKHEIEGRRLSPHNSTPNTFVYAPIKTISTEEVWFIINTVESPWGFDNSVLFKIYADASADDYECPTVVTNKKHTTCGQSRFGCWTCTVVKEDKSMSALIANGNQWMEPLLSYRKELVDGRNLPKNRMNRRRNGMPAVDEEGNNFGTYSPEYRAKLLRLLLETQKKIQVSKPHIQLITNQELIAIQITWHRDGIFEHAVNNIYRKIYGQEFSTSNSSILSPQESAILKDVCRDEPDYQELIERLLAIQESKSLLISKYGLHNDIEKQIERFLEPKK